MNGVNAVPPDLVAELLEAMPDRFTLGEILEAAERRGVPTRADYQAYALLKAHREIRDTGF